MINPVIYFALNKEMRLHLTRAFSDCLNWVCCVNGSDLSDWRKSSKRSDYGSCERKYAVFLATHFIYTLSHNSHNH
jgi:hypothetical protein